MTTLFHLRCAGAIVVCAVLIIAGVRYVFDAQRRATATECIDVTSESGLYRAESCVMGGNGDVEYYVGRLYDVHSSELLARVDFDSMDGGKPEFMPDESAVLFKGAGDSGDVRIPPNWYDQLRARLP